MEEKKIVESKYMKIEQAMEELKKGDKRKFLQTVDLIINLQKFDVRKESINTFAFIPYPAPKKICGFLSKKTPIVDSIMKEEFDRFKEEADIKRLAKKYDAFIAVASVMPAVATKFGRILGPLGKMPSPQAGIIPTDGDQQIKDMIAKMSKAVRLKTKERSLKLSIGKEDMTPQQIAENARAILSVVENALPRKKDNIKNVMLKLTMSKPIKVEF
jgi:large subunit ribosomal protein L1